MSRVKTNSQQCKGMQLISACVCERERGVFANEVDTVGQILDTVEVDCERQIDHLQFRQLQTSLVTYSKVRQRLSTSWANTSKT